jgi:hypothetical protein
MSFLAMRQLVSNLSKPLTVCQRGFASHKHQKLLGMAKGYMGRAKTCYSVALQRVHKALQYAYRSENRINVQVIFDIYENSMNHM